MIDDFHYEHPNWVSQPFAGGVQLQIEVIGKDFADVAVQTRLSEESKFVNLKSVFVENGKPRIIAIDKYAEGQQFRIRLKCESRYVRIFKSDIASMATAAAVSAISDRVKDLEDAKVSPEISNASSVKSLLVIGANGKTVSIKPEVLVDHILTSALEYDVLALTREKTTSE